MGGTVLVDKNCHRRIDGQELRLVRSLVLTEMYLEAAAAGEIIDKQGLN